MKFQLITWYKQVTKPNHYRSRTMVAVLVLIAVLLALFQLWQLWPSLVVSSIQWQREVNTQLADLIYDAKENPITVGGYLIGFSFLYGMLHSLGPGHGKVIVTTYLATHPTKIKTSLVLTVISAFCQALVAIVLVSVLVWGYSASMRVVNEQAMYLVTASFALVVLFGGGISWKAVNKIINVIRSPKLRFSALKPVNASLHDEGKLASKLKPYKLQQAPLLEKHSESADVCGCGHQHFADANTINNASSIREYAAIVLSIGIRPCTGAVMVLLFSNTVDLYWMGVISAVVMAAGTALTISLIGVMTLTGKKIVKHYLNHGHSASDRHNTNRLKLAGYYVQFLGGLLLAIIGLLLMNGQSYGMSPLFAF